MAPLAVVPVSFAVFAFDNLDSGAAGEFDAVFFTAATGLVLTLFLALARASQDMVRQGGESDDEPDAVAPPSNARRVDATGDGPAGTDHVVAESAATGTRSEDQGVDSTTRTAGPARSEPTVSELSTGALLVNVAFTQGLFGVLVLAAAWYAGAPARAFGITPDPISTGLPAVLVGAVLGVALYVANELGAATADAAGVDYDERLRSQLAPDTVTGWLVLLVLVLPVVAGVEEFVFRAAVIGGVHAGFGTSPWALAVVSSLAFALGHGAQGTVGIVVTGVLGFVLAAAFIVTGSFVVAFVAHYLVNALEFVVHELLGVEWGERLVG